MRAWLLQKATSMVAAVAAVLELDDISTIKEERRMTLKAFLGGKDVFGIYSRLALVRV